MGEEEREKEEEEEEGECTCFLIEGRGVEGGRYIGEMCYSAMMQ